MKKFFDVILFCEPHIKGDTAALLLLRLTVLSLIEKFLGPGSFEVLSQLLACFSGGVCLVRGET